MKVLVVVEDYGLNGASAIGVFTEANREAADLLADLEPGRGTTGYGGAEVMEFEVDALPSLGLRDADLAWRWENRTQRRSLARWVEIGGTLQREVSP